MYYLEKYDDDIHAHPAHLLAEIALPEQQFDELLGLARLGRLPSSLNMEVAGLQYGFFFPDGSEKKWNIEEKSSQRLAIKHIDFSIPLGGAAIAEMAEESGKGLGAQLAGIRESLRWIGFFVFAIVVVLIWQATTSPE